MSLKHYLEVIRRRWAVAVSVFVACLLAAVVVTMTATPQYEAQSQLFITTPIDGANLSQQLFQGGTFSAERVKSYASLATTPRVLQPVINQFSLNTDSETFSKSVTATAPQDTVLIEISVTDPDPQLSAKLADAVAGQLSRTINDLESVPGSLMSPVRATLSNQAQVPSVRSSPKTGVNILVGVLVGLAGGVAFALATDALDTKVRSRKELSRLTGLPSLGVIPRSRSGNPRELTSAGGIEGPDDARQEQFRQLRLSLDYVSVDNPPRTILVTSPMPGDGKSCVAGSLARTFADLGYRTCLVDADLKKPSVAEYFEVVGDVGLTSVLVGRIGLTGAIQQIDRNLSVITSGPIPPNSAELLNSQRAAAVLAELSDAFDKVVIDTTPLLPASDASVVAARVNGTILVARVAKSTKAEVEEGLELLRRVNANVLGSVLNGVESSGLGYGYGYGSVSSPQAFNEALTPTGRGNRSWDGQRKTASISDSSTETDSYRVRVGSNSKFEPSPSPRPRGPE